MITNTIKTQMLHKIKYDLKCHLRTQIAISIFLIEKPGFNVCLKIIGVQINYL